MQPAPNKDNVVPYIRLSCAKAEKHKEAPLEEKRQDEVRLAREEEVMIKQKAQQKLQEQKDLHSSLEPGTKDGP